MTMVPLKLDLLKLQDGIPSMKLVSLKTDLLKLQDGIPSMKLVSLKTDLLKLQLSMSLNCRWTLAMSLDLEARTLAMSLDMEARTLLLWRASISHPHLLKTSSLLSLSVSSLGKTLGHPPVT
ncbi:unnamed protein product [Gadus morhua 'NCC']